MFDARLPRQYHLRTHRVSLALPHRVIPGVRTALLPTSPRGIAHALPYPPQILRLRGSSEPARPAPASRHPAARTIRRSDVVERQPATKPRRAFHGDGPVSYTHLTLPTIYSV